MDPNAALLRIRTAMVEIHSPSTHATLEERAAEMIEAFGALDQWLQKGGFPPDAWTQTDEIMLPVERTIPRDP